MARFIPLALAAIVVATLAIDPVHSRAADPPAVAPGTRVAGLDAGGVPATAAARLDALLGPSLRRPIEVPAGDHRLRLTARRARTRLDAGATAQRALGATAGADVAPAIDDDRDHVDAFVARVARTVCTSACQRGVS